MSAYREAVAYLNEQLPMFSKIGGEAIKKGLDNIIKLCEALGNPHLKFPAVHIAGTNGKGSTSHMIAGAFQHCGYKTGLYTSPHLVDLRERVRIDGVPVSEDFVVRFVAQTRNLVKDIQPSYFELNVAMAFLAFAEAEVDIAVIETGLGGRLDSTNIITPVLSIITNIGLDHTQILGNTLAEIATEKAGIIKQGVPALIGETQAETEQVFFLNALNKQTTAIYAYSIWDLVRIGQDASSQQFKAIHKGEQKMYSVSTDLLGNFQAHNIKTVLAAGEILQQLGWTLPTVKIIESLAKVKSSTGLRGRWEWLHQSPNVIFDVAHNPAGIEYLLENLAALGYDDAKDKDAGQLRIVCGFVKDKDVASALKMLPKKAIYYFTNANIPRALPASELQILAKDAGLAGAAYETVSSAWKAAKRDAGLQDTILVTGSFFIVGEAIEASEKMNSDELYAM